MEALERLLSDIDVHNVGGIDFEEFVAANLKDQVIISWPNQLFWPDAS